MLAVDAVKNKTMSRSRACEVYGVPRTTVYDWIAREKREKQAKFNKQIQEIVQNDPMLMRTTPTTGFTQRQDQSIVDPTTLYCDKRLDDDKDSGAYHLKENDRKGKEESKINKQLEEIIQKDPMLMRTFPSATASATKSPDKLNIDSMKLYIDRSLELDSADESERYKN